MTSTNDKPETFRTGEPPRPPFWANARPVSDTMQPIITTELAYVIYQLPKRGEEP